MLLSTQSQRFVPVSLDPLHRIALNLLNQFQSFRMVLRELVAGRHHKINIDQILSRRHHVTTLFFSLDHGARSQQSCIHVTGQQSRHRSRDIHRDEFHILDTHAFFHQGGHHQLVQNRTARTGNLLALQILHGHLLALLTNDRKHIRRMGHAVDDHDLIAFTVGRQKRSRVHHSRDVQRTGSHRTRLMRTGIDRVPNHLRAVFGKGFFK